MRPIWYYDDLDLQFQQIWLQFYFPLLACAASLVVILTKASAHFLSSLRHHKYNPLIDVSEEEEDLTLQKTVTNTSTYENDKPKAATGVVTFELLLICAQLAISITALVLAREPRYAFQIAYIAFWAYLLILALFRFFLTAVECSLPFLKLWNHCAIIYGIEWLCEVMIFRSALLHPLSPLSRDLTVAHFALTTALGIVVLTSRQGNRVVKLEHEGNIEPSKEPTASILGKLTFSWTDSIVWKGFKRPLELEDVWNVTLKDKAEQVLDRFRQVKKTHILAVRLLQFFKKPILMQGLWCTISSIAMFMPTLLLKAILEYLEDPVAVPASAAWLYVILLFFTGIVQALGDGQSLWIGRKICIQIRAVIVGEIYSKVLRRKAAAAAESEVPKTDPKEPVTFWRRLQFWKRKSSKPTANGYIHNKPDAITQASNGTVINLMSIDSFKVAEISAYLHFLWAATPVQLIMAVALLYKVLGYSSFAGIVLMVLVLPWNMWIAKSFTRAQQAILAATDARIHATNEVLQNIRIIKYFAWEQRFESTVNEKRENELRALWKKYVLWAAAYTIWGGVPVLITFTSFLIYTKVEQRPLVPSIAFPALSMFSLLRIPLDQLADMVAHVQESKVSVDRVEEFLREEETEKYVQMQKSKQASPHETRIALDHATLSWGTKADTSKGDSNSFRLIDMDIDFVIGKLNVIAGPTGSGKTSLLMALLGEMQLLDGTVHIPGGYSRQSLRPDPETGLTESVAYCAQQAWLVNATIEENILFASPFNAKRYKDVIAACALKRDLEILDAGDQTLVGEKGITLSGGQKQRISLARALYSNSKHILADDCLSAVDSHTAKHIFDRALLGPLMENRTCILVSHNVALVVPSASHVVVLNNGKIATQGSPIQIAESGVLGEEMAKSVPASRMPSAAPSRAPSPPGEEAVNEISRAALPMPEEIDVPEESLAKADRKFVDTRIETKAVGSVKLSTITMYLRAMGPWYYWIFAVSGFIAVQVGSVATNVWIREWANAYHTSSKQTQLINALGTPSGHSHQLSHGIMFQTPPLRGAIAMGPANITEQVDSTYYLVVYALIGTGFIAICFTREMILFWGSLRASRALHERLLGRILRATFRFFDSTPLGQLTNRFSKDLQSIDQEVAPVAIGLLHSAASVITIVALISAITPSFLIPGLFIAGIYTATGMLYIRSSRDLKRLESVQRSPLFQQFGETLSGVVTIRAYGDEARFVSDNFTKVNTHNRPFIYLWATNRWLAFRVDCAGALVAFFSAMFVVLNVGNIDPGAAGLSLSYAITFTQNVLWLVRLYASNEQNMNAVERVQEYIDVEQEAPADIPENKPSTSWPSQGAVEFVNYSTRYRKDLDPVLRNVSFGIAAGEKVGIVGRTGAGKSSLALALFRGLEAEEGKILIDSVDIGQIGLQDLREAITIVPQDPTLFTGSLRSNLDPFELFTDQEIFTALRRVQLITGVRHVSDQSHLSSTDVSSEAPTLNGTADLLDDDDNPGSTSNTLSSAPTLVRFKSNAKDNKNIFYDLNTAIAESGSNLSQGQRQLLCLARALLKSPKVLVMDEATASIDYATDSKIQDTLRELKENTIITIAHRLQTIIDYDKVLVLDKGEVVEYAHPWELLQKEEGSFRGMCETSGDLDILLDLAKKAWDAKRLVDV